MIYRSLLIVLGLLTVAATRGPDDLQFRRLTVIDGLSQNSVYDIIQDRLGFVWIATQDGLNRYDGYEFRVFKHDPDDANSLSGNSISAVYEDQEGILWVGTHKNGLNRFDPVNRTFDHYLPSPDEPGALPHEFVTAIAEDGEGRLWVGTAGGLARLDAESDTFVQFEHDTERPGTLAADLVTALLVDHSGTLWAGTRGGGLNRFDADRDAFESYGVDPGNPRGLQSDNVTAIHEDSRGELWVGTAGGGLSRFDPTTETFEHMRRDPDDGASLSSDEVSAIYEDGSGAIWVGTWSGGLNRLNPERTEFSRFEAGGADQFGLGDNRIHTIMEDRSGVLWIGTGLGGISHFDRHRVMFEHLVHDPADPNSLSDNTIWSIHEGRGGIVWIGTNAGGLNRYDRSTGRFDHYKRIKGDRSTIGADLVRSIYEASNGDLWLGTSVGLEVFRPGRGVVRRFSYDEDDPASLPSRLIHILHEDQRGMMWIGTGRGLFQYDPSTSTFVRSPKEAAAEFESLQVLAIYEAPSGDLWIGSTTGLHKLSRESDDLITYRHDPEDPGTISSDLVYAVLQDKRGVVWAGTFGGGLNRLEPETGVFRRWTEQNSDLPTNTVLGILEDDAGYLWLSTHRGLTRFDPETDSFRVFGDRHGVQSPEFNSGAAHAGVYSGDLYFGGINGVNIVKPGAIVDNPTGPQVNLMELRLRSDVAAVTERASDTMDLGAINEVTLDHNENDFWIDYVGLHFARPGSNRYAYMLENYDEGWRYVGGLREAAYTNLDPGDYVFRVKAANADGVWNEEGASLQIRIRPPWWKTVWAYGAYGLVFVLGVFAVDQVQRRRLIKQERAHGQIREARLRARTLELENQRQTRELEEARQLQLSMLPDSVPKHPTVEIDAFMRTATEVGGDYYDFHLTPDDTLTIVIGDATDHGARAGTMVTAVKSLFSVLAEEEALDRFVERATRALKRMHFHRMFMALAVVRIEGHQLRMSGAGMPPALVMRHESGVVERVALKGMPLGSLVDYPYTESEIVLRAADTVLLMSDGFAERFNDRRELFGYENTVSAFKETRGMSPRQVIEHLVSISDDWAGSTKSTDDITFVVVKAKGEIS